MSTGHLSHKLRELQSYRATGGFALPCAGEVPGSAGDDRDVQHATG